MKKYSLGALVAAGLLAGGLSAGSASAADLGGNCCADLEERIAELEATTARKGNRKVSLTISGWVGEQIMWFDNDAGGFSEDNVYVGGLGTTLSSHFKFTGQATISPGWYAGYVMHVEVITGDSLTQNEDVSRGPALYGIVAAGGGPGSPTSGPGIELLQSFWFVKSDHLGKVSVGLQSQASDNTAILVDGSGSLVPANWVAFDFRAFRLSNGSIYGGGSCGTMGGALGDCNGLTQNVIRYDSPTFGGFSVSASWGEDDMWDVAARYAGEHAGFKVAAAVAYNEVNSTGYVVSYDGGVTNYNMGGYNNLGSLDANYFQAGGYIEHVPTGVFGLINYGKYDQVGVPEIDTYYFKAGLRERWTPLGHTVLYGEYMTIDNAFGDSVTGDFDLWGLGVVQEIDAAAMSLWVSYRDVSASNTNANGYGEGDFQYIKAGALINF
jgi:predicted porin